jgi:uncharacterized protein YxeA
MKNKKKLIAALALVFVQSIANTALAATTITANSLVDVPKNSWAYESVEKLAKAGIIEGYGDGTFRGDRNLTRYELAVIVAKAIANQEKVDASQKNEIARLQTEFSVELANIGVRVTTLENRVGTLKWSGDARIRVYQANPTLAGKSDGTPDINRTQERVRLAATAQIDDNWTFNGRLGVQGTTNRNAWAAGSVPGSASGDFTYDRAEFVYNKGSFTSSIGRSTLFLGQGSLYDFAFDGIKLQTNKGKFIAKGYVGDASLTNTVWTTNANSSTVGATENFSALDLSYAFNKNLSVTATKYKNISKNYNYDVTAFGGSAVSGDFSLVCETLHNSSNGLDTTAQRNGNWAKLIYKATNLAKPGTYDLWFKYQKIGKNAIDAAPTTFNYASNLYGTKGWETGVDYIFAKNARAALWYANLTPYDKNVNNFDFNKAYTFALFYNF